MSNKLAGIHATLAKKAEQLVALAKAEGISIIITQGLRTIAEQNALYAKGRTTAGPKVTNAKGGTSYHNYGLAFDFAVVEKNGKINWTVDKRWLRVGALGKTLGLEWGGDFKSIKDVPHFQLTFGLSIANLQAGKRPAAGAVAKKAAVAKPAVAAAPKYPGVVLKAGVKGQAASVKLVQAKVGVKADGDFGPNTEKAVKAWQKAKKLTADGQVGPTTWKAMF